MSGQVSAIVIVFRIKPQWLITVSAVPAHCPRPQRRDRNLSSLCFYKWREPGHEKRTTDGCMTEDIKWWRYKVEDLQEEIVRHTKPMAVPFSSWTLLWHLVQLHKHGWWLPLGGKGERFILSYANENYRTQRVCTQTSRIKNYLLTSGKENRPGKMGSHPTSPLKSKTKQNTDRSS
jgi:hypothetical protein